MGVGDVSKRILLGRKLRSAQLGETLLPKRIALPVFASDALSSVAYAPDEVFIMLAIAGASQYIWSWKIAIAVALVMAAVIASYRQTVHAYPSGGGDYEVATVNLGRTAGITVASALLVDYVLTVAVSISSGANYAASALPAFQEHEATVAVVMVVLLTAMNLRGIRESGSFFAVPTYLFMFAILGMCAFGFVEMANGSLPLVESADLDIAPKEGWEEPLTTFGLMILLARAFSSGCAALTGVEAISNGVPAFKKPKSRNAATTLLLLGTVAVTMLVGIIALSRLTGLQYVESPSQIISGPTGYVQKTVTTQLGETVFGDGSVMLYIVAAATALILFLAANTAFNGFPVLGSILAQDRYLPRQLHTRGDRLAFSNGIIGLAAFAIVLVIAFDAEVTKLIQLYIVGVFVSFTMSQTGMIRHWNRHLAKEKDPAERRRMRRSQGINAFGLAMTGAVLVVVLITKFLLGAWIAIAAMAAIYALMTGIRRHYDRVSDELAKAEGKDPFVLPSRIHTIVLVSKLHLPTKRALAYARATRPDVLEAITVNVDDVDTKRLVREWEKQDFKVPLKVIESPYREITKPVLDYVKRVRTDNPRDVVTVFIPEYVVGHWWEQFLHNQSALRLKGRLLFQPGVMVTSVPWQLQSSEGVQEPAVVAPGLIRRGLAIDEETERR
ncbi:MAG TPA: APC family permease [Actinokineospora sp.]|nr:APC family permease [Actinokineospora sp.]